MGFLADRDSAWSTIGYHNNYGASCYLLRYDWDMIKPGRPTDDWKLKRPSKSSNRSILHFHPISPQIGTYPT